jgi:hypothetical protein
MFSYGASRYATSYRNASKRVKLVVTKEAVFYKVFGERDDVLGAFIPVQRARNDSTVGWSVNRSLQQRGYQVFFAVIE